MSTILYRDGSAEMKDGLPIVVDDQIKLKKEFVVRMIKNTGSRKECIAAVSDRYTLHRALPFD